MFSNKYIGVAILLMATHTSYAQDIKTYKGSITNAKDLLGINNVQIITLPQQDTFYTTGEGIFEITLGDQEVRQLVFSKKYYQTDTVAIQSLDEFGMYYLEPVVDIDGATVTSRVNSTEISTFGVRKVEKISSKELMKAACCNLSESFETTPSVDVGFTDAVSGYKQIQMLGLTGSHTLFTRENIPDVRGVAAITGLTFTPGTFVESMQLSKGSGSVVNGYEGTAGQINVEWLKPFESKTPTLLLNGYQSHQGRSEGNVVWSTKVSEHTSTNVFLHAKSNWLNLDQNKDYFLDQPLGEAYVVGNRWFHFSPKGWEIQGGVKGTFMNNRGGTVKQSEAAFIPWIYEQKVNRAEAWAKIGRVYEGQPWKSMGLQLSGVYHDQKGMYAQTKNYDANQQSFYANYIYQSMIKNTNHIIKTGASFQYDAVKENYNKVAYQRNEITPGVFGEYSYSHLEKFNVVAGLRADYHNIYGAFVTPRLHVRYAPTDKSAIRASIGSARRTANVFAENFALMASNRTFSLNGNGDAALPYGGMKQEQAWNMGINYTQKFRLNYRDGAFSFDYYYTHFQNQIVVDIENPTQVRLYNLDGRSFAHSLQAQLDYEIIRKLDVRLAYRLYDVKTTFDGQLLEKALVARHRGFINIAYETRNQWKFDLTYQVFGSKRMPMHSTDGVTLTDAYRTPVYDVWNMQISKTMAKERLDVYAGVENVFGKMQHNLILNATNPSNPYFDASLIWGQAMGRNIYIGFRYRIGGEI